jgi:hypothetical protein
VCKTVTYDNGNSQCVPLGFSATSEDEILAIIDASEQCDAQLVPECESTYINFWTTWSDCAPCGSFAYREKLSDEVSLTCILLLSRTPCCSCHCRLVLHPLFSNIYSNVLIYYLERSASCFLLKHLRTTACCSTPAQHLIHTSPLHWYLMLGT